MQIKVELIDHMGSDLRAANAARVSFKKESNGLSERDIKLINYLGEHRDHYTPFTHNMITLRETVPIFVARQRFKHTVGFSYNEVSRRYVDDTPEFYVPDVWRGRPAGSLKQGSNGTVEVICDSNSDEFFTPNYLYKELVDKALILYRDMITGGVAPEMARMVLPQSMMTSYYVTGSLSAFARAYKLRADDHAQLEIQYLAREWDTIMKELFPHSWAALTGEQP
jgi:thymidylate synthase (FAD)